MSSDSNAPSGYVDPSFPNPNGPWDTPVIIYGYTPSFALAAFAAAWFSLLFAAHLFQVVRRRSWYFVVFPVGLLFEVVGYVARCLSARRDPYHLLYFILDYFFIVTAPVFLAAGVYTVLSGLIARLGREYSVVGPGLVLGFFIVSDVVATVVQITGAALIGVQESNRGDPSFANDILLGGLAYQVFSLGVFTILAGTFLFRARRALRDYQRGRLVGFAAAFGVATVLVYLRTCFRLAETAQGLDGSLGSNEVYFACLEFAPVAGAVLLLAVWAPGRHLGRRVRVRDGDGNVKD